MTATFTVNRENLRDTRWQEHPDGSLVDGQVRLRIDRFALTSNNVTYGAFGEAMHYWDFFPTGDAATGCIPVWGFATVVESRSAGVEVGERFYGYFPMADQVVLQPGKIGAAGFFDAAPHRRALHGIYNQYLRCTTDALYREGHESLLALLRPLFITSFLIDDFLADNQGFGASVLLVSSASSKTAYGLGFCLSQRRGGAGAMHCVGLTSPGNVDFTRHLGCYDQVVDYADVETLATDAPAAYVDMSGNATLRARIHGHWQNKLMYSCSVGGTHWEALGGAKGLPGPRPTLFFAPAQASKRLADWGPTGLQDRMAAAWQAFVARASDPQSPWIRVVPGQGRDAVASTYHDLLAGRVSADEGRILAV
jgi:hypothetical protein